MEQGTVLRIEKTSIYDGEGLRTVVYLKGCPLRCRWCSTPESQKQTIEKGFGKRMTTKEVMKEIEKDSIFYFHSRGGITISGGEALIQADFTRELLQESVYLGINTALETSFFVEYYEIKKVGPFLNDVFIDIKLFDAEKHRQWTGHSNGLILRNIEKFTQEFPDCSVHIRIPVIPTVNMNQTELLKITKFVGELSAVEDLELLPYHRYGLQSYRQLGIDYGMENLESPSEGQMFELAEFLSAQVPNLKILTLSESFGK
ncbi:glycyl-radical enzyme activating protein [Enterococcus raffinosus]|uniref:glycyl-radical enzyme activating protein n=1 Tax=Enterococcus raffinosus TaxID=71452 RepID=UPI001C985A61|nr:glycyl-radical enzyme activating protein [Enterococcus raffinosus]QZO10906.1 glycyl-radical enzyme activating protein [Enterococcus raffinosus]